MEFGGFCGIWGNLGNMAEVGAISCYWRKTMYFYGIAKVRSDEQRAPHGHSRFASGFAPKSGRKRQPSAADASLG